MTPKRYEVCVTTTCMRWFDVDADNDDDAESQAVQLYKYNDVQYEEVADVELNVYDAA